MQQAHKGNPETDTCTGMKEVIIFIAGVDLEVRLLHYTAGATTHAHTYTHILKHIYMQTLRHKIDWACENQAYLHK